MSTSNVADGDPTANNMSIVDTAPSITVATSDGPTSRLLRLPLELQKMIWIHVIANCRPTIRQTRVAVERANPSIQRCKGRTPVLDVQRIESIDDKTSTYPPHPLCYVSKTISNEVREQIYQTALFMMSPSNCYEHPRMAPPVKRLSLNVEEASRMLKAVMPCVAGGTKSPKKELVLTSIPGLKYLEISWHSEFMLDRRIYLCSRFQRTLTRLRFFRRSFEVEMKFFLHYSLFKYPQAGEVFCTGILTNTPITFKYQNDHKKDLEFEKAFAWIICAGSSEQERKLLDKFVVPFDPYDPGEPRCLSAPGWLESWNGPRPWPRDIHFDE